MEKQFKYIYKGQEVSKEEFTAITKDMFKWFENNTINAVDYSSISSFFGENYKSKGEINNHLKGVLQGGKFPFDSTQQNNFVNIPFGNNGTGGLKVFFNKELDTRLDNLQDKFKKAVDNCVSDGDFSKKEKEETYDSLNTFLKVNTTDSQRNKLESIKQKFAEAGAKSGEKHNKLKAPLDILQTRQFSKALQLLALATSYGNHKYKDTDLDFLNFKRVEGGSQTYLDASARHSTDRDNLDSESGLHHFIHGVWNQLAALEIWAEENKINIEKYSKNYLENLQN